MYGKRDLLMHLVTIYFPITVVFILLIVTTIWSPEATEPTPRDPISQPQTSQVRTPPGGAVSGTTKKHTNRPEPDRGCVIVNRVGGTKFYKSTSDSKGGEGDDIYTDEPNTALPFPDSSTDTVITPQISR